MKTKLTYTIKDIIINNKYTQIIITDKQTSRKNILSDGSVSFKYEPKVDQAYLCFGNAPQYKDYEINDSNINEVIIDDTSLTIETDTGIYYCQINQERLLY